MKQCVRCGLPIKEETNRLWCPKCLKRVHEELEGRADRKFEYYFKHHLKKMKKEKDLF